MCPVSCLSLLTEDTDERDLRPPRPALGGGFDQRPPSDRVFAGKVIPFPLERIRPSAEDQADQTDADAPERGSPSDGALWAAWLSGVVSGRSSIPGVL
jgi:hypothetical protein